MKKRACTALLVLLPATAFAQEEGEDHRDSLRSTIDEVSTKRFLHGFRLGYLNVMNIDGPADATDPNSPSLAEKYKIRSPHQFLIGYEAAWRMVGHDWLNILLVGNVMISGLEQSRVFPSANALIGFEMFETLQLGVGVNAVPQEEKPAHMLIAAGWTPRVGDIYTPLHAFFVPDVDGQHRFGLTIGVNW
jgi:hypothetical protein